jgi:hypothetical protein
MGGLTRASAAGRFCSKSRFYPQHFWFLRHGFDGRSPVCCMQGSAASTLKSTPENICALSAEKIPIAPDKLLLSLMLSTF